MKKVIITLELEDDKFEEMERVLLNNRCSKDNHKNWDAHVIETYNKTISYLECNGGDLNRAYRDMIYDF